MLEYIENSFRITNSWASLVFQRVKHPQYKKLSDYDKKNTFDVAAFLSRRLEVRGNDVYEVHEYEASFPPNSPAA